MHTDFMRRALRLARRGLGRTSPNPVVGAVVVRDGRIVGEGYHAQCGGPHAEVVALQKAGPRARGATVYVTLEPCSHHGRTPPCTAALIEARVAEVFYAVGDPDPRVAGRGARRLSRADIAVHEGPLGDEARRLNEAYFKHRLSGMPFVTLKMAVTLDGKVATRTGSSLYITGEPARRAAHRLRREADAVMVGVGTVLADDPSLTTRLVRGRDAVRVILDPQARTPPNARVIAADSPADCLVVVGPRAPSARCEALASAGAAVIRSPGAGSRLDLRAALAKLADRGLLSVLCEGGPTIAAALIEERLVDKVILFMAPKVIGGQQAPTAVEGRGIGRLAEAWQLAFERVRRVGEDIMIEARPCSPD